MLASDWIILFEADLFSRVLRVLGSVVCTVTRKFTDQTNQLALCILLRHTFPYCTFISTRRMLGGFPRRTFGGFQRLIIAKYSLLYKTSPLTIDNDFMEPRSGLEPETSSLPWMRSTN